MLNFNFLSPLIQYIVNLFAWHAVSQRLFSFLHVFHFSTLCSLSPLHPLKLKRENSLKYIFNSIDKNVYLFIKITYIFVLIALLNETYNLIFKLVSLYGWEKIIFLLLKFSDLTQQVNLKWRQTKLNGFKFFSKYVIKRKEVFQTSLFCQYFSSYFLFYYWRDLQISDYRDYLILAENHWKVA